MNEVLVMKFGGTSVGCARRIRNAAAIAAANEGPLAVVVSAMAGTTDDLLRMSRSRGGAPSLTALRERHFSAAREAVCPDLLPEVEERLEGHFSNLQRELGTPHESMEVRQAAVATIGERLAAEILRGALADYGRRASIPQDPIATDSVCRAAEVDPSRTHRQARRHVTPLLERGEVAVVPGFAGRSPRGTVTTLGRGGSDLSATALGRALGAARVEILTDVEGVLSADPALVSQARLIPYLSWREAALFSALGAKVLHPQTMHPAAQAGMEVVVRSSFSPYAPGTSIRGEGIRPGIHGLGIRPGEGVVGVGDPVDGELGLGIEALAKAGIEVREARRIPEGLLFGVAEEDERQALRVLHSVVLSEAVEAVA